MTNRKAFFDIIRAKVFHGVMHQRQVDGVNSILEAWDKAVPNADARFVAYALATAHWETAGTMQPIEEYGRGCGHRYGEPAGPCGNCYYGRGFVQLTWLENYQRAEAELHKRSVLKPEESLVENPELALRPDVAAAIMIHGMLEGWFTGHKLADFFHGDCSDWIEARTIINGHNRARQVAGDALHFYAALQAQRKAPAVEPAPGKPEVLKDRKAFFDIVRDKIFHGTMRQRQVDGMNSILEAWEKAAPNADPRFVAYALATAHWETAGTMQPIEEYGHGCGHPYGEPAGPCGNCYYGRGFIQLTWLENYEKAETELRKLGVLEPEESLVKNPELALRPDVAAAIMIHGMLEGWFTGRKLADFFHADCSDWIDARTIINRHDHDAQIAGDALHFYAALEAQSNAAALQPTDRVGFHKFYVIGDSIAHGTAAAMEWPGNYHDGRSYALVCQCEIPQDIDVLVVSTLTNPQPKADDDWAALEPSLVNIRGKIDPRTQVVWILPSPKFPKERKIIADFAQKHGDRSVGFTPGRDGVHPASYKRLAHDVLTVLAQSNLAGAA